MVNTIVFIHGWASGPEIWQRQKEYFGRKYDVITPDISLAKDLTGAVSVVNTAIKNKDDSILIGWSLGWLVVLEWLRQCAIKPKGLIAVNATAKFCDDGYLGKGPTETHLAKMIRDCKRNPRKVFEDFYKSILTETDRNTLSNMKLKNIDYDTLIYGLYILRSCDYREAISTIAIPTLIISGVKDTICIPEASEYMHKRIKGSELKVFDCGHMSFIAKADGFNAAIDNFIKQCQALKAILVPDVDR